VDRKGDVNHDILLGNADEFQTEVPVASFNYVSPGFFETLQTHFLAGRDFDERDLAGAPNVAIVNDAFVKKFAAEKNPLEVTFRVRRLKHISAPLQIVGIVEDTKYVDLREKPGPIVYTPMAQNDEVDSDALILLRSREPLAVVLSGVKTIASQMDPSADLSFYNLHKMINDGLLRDRLMARLSGFFGLLAVLLAVIGLYGVISYMVARRRNEIGIRMSLGATPASIVRLVLHESFLLLSVGLVIGIVFALMVSNVAASLLFGLKPHDPATFVLAIVILASTAFAASYLPAWWASKLDPMDALGHE
jgi:putative ABC transport system permease protein